MDDTSRAIGVIEGRLAGVDGRLKTIEEGMVSQDVKLDTLLRRSEVVKSNGRLVLGIGTFAVGFTAVVSALGPELVKWLKGL